MQYRAHVRLDFDNQDTGNYQRLIAAFLQVGWCYVQTSAVAIDTDDLSVILRGMELLAKQVPDSGTLTGLMFDIQGSHDFNGIEYQAANNYPNAADDIRAKPLP